MRTATRRLGWLSLHEKRIPEVHDRRRKKIIHTQTESPTHSSGESESTRGGFGRCEAIVVLEDRAWTEIDVETADKKLKEMVELWESNKKQIK